jgi:ketosteroid isomerase-like protein
MHIKNCDEAAIYQFHNELASAINSYDFDKVLSLHSENVIVIEPFFPAIDGKNQLRNNFNDLLENKTSINLQFQIAEVEISGKKAFARGHFTNLSAPGHKINLLEKGKFVSILEKQAGGQWIRTHVIVESGLPDV